MFKIRLNNKKAETFKLPRVNDQSYDNMALLDNAGPHTYNKTF